MTLRNFQVMSGKFNIIMVGIRRLVEVTHTNGSLSTVCSLMKLNAILISQLPADTT
jgi:hypothetical protein